MLDVDLRLDSGRSRAFSETSYLKVVLSRHPPRSARILHTSKLGRVVVGCRSVKQVGERNHIEATDSACLDKLLHQE